MGSTWSMWILLLITLAGECCAWVPCRIPTDPASQSDSTKYQLCLQANRGSFVPDVPLTKNHVTNHDATFLRLIRRALCMILWNRNCAFGIGEYKSWIKNKNIFSRLQVSPISKRRLIPRKRWDINYSPVFRIWPSLRHRVKNWLFFTKVLPMRLLTFKLMNGRDKRTAHNGQLTPAEILEKYRRWRQAQGRTTGNGRWGR